MIYAVVVEDGLNETELGNLTSATFVTDMATRWRSTPIYETEGHRFESCRARSF